MYPKINIRKPILSVIFIFVISIIGFTLNSCNENPTGLGYTLDSVSVKTLSADSLVVSSRTLFQRYKGLHPNGLFVGKNTSNDGTSIESFSVLQFYFPIADTALLYLTANDIVSAEIKMCSDNYTFGDTNSFGFEMHEITKSPLNATWDTLADADGKMNSFFNPQILGTFSNKISYNSAYDSISVSLNNKQTIIDWIKLSSDTSSSLVTKWSIALKATNSCNSIHRFFSDRVGQTSPYVPKLKVVYRDKDSVNKFDTLWYPVLNSYTFLNTPKPNDDSRIFVQAGVTLRGEIELNASSVPKFASIIKSQLILHIDTSLTRIGNFGKDSLNIDSLLNASATDQLDSNGLSTFPFTAALSKTTLTYTFPSVSSALERWNRTGNGKGKITLAYFKDANSSNERTYLDRYVFYGSKYPNPALRPKLLIFYSERPNLKK